MVRPMVLDDRLRDDAALDEIELTGRLIIAASQHSEHLTQGEVDEILGVTGSSTAGKPIAS